MNPSNGHLNTMVRDHDSPVTGYGKHDRVICFQPKGNELYMRVDHKWGLGMPTESQMLEAGRRHQDVKGRWKLASIEPWDNQQCTDVIFHRRGAA